MNLPIDTNSISSEKQRNEIVNKMGGEIITSPRRLAIIEQEIDNRIIIETPKIPNISHKPFDTKH